MLLGNINGPGCGSMATIQHPLKRTDWWEYQAIVENNLKDLLLALQSLCFFLP
jgi:hypothetical protein